MKAQNITYDPIYMKYPEQANLDSRLVVVRDWKKERMWRDFTGYKVSFGSHKNILKLDNGNIYTTP